MRPMLGTNVRERMRASVSRNANMTKEVLYERGDYDESEDEGLATDWSQPAL